MPSIEEIITDVIQAEGGAAVTNDPVDAGDRTQYGISEAANPAAWADGAVTEKEAREIYLQKYVVWPKFHTIPPSHAKLQAQLIDFGVTSGPQHVIQQLQRLLGVDVDSKLGPQTLQAIRNTDPRILNNNLMAIRIKMVGRVVAKNPTQIKWLNGWLNRCLEFMA